MNQVEPSVSVLGWKSLCLAVVIPVSWLRSMKNLSFTSLAGTISLVVALVVTMVYGFKYEMDDFREFQPELAKFDVGSPAGPLAGRLRRG
jgi:amino acid permease